MWAECIGESVDTPLSLVIWGPSRTGKPNGRSLWVIMCSFRVFMIFPFGKRIAIM